MPVIPQPEHIVIAVLLCILVWMVWKHHHRRLRKLWEKVKAGRPRRWRAKSPHDCPSCREGLGLTVQRVAREIAPWSQVKSSRGRKKQIETRGFACPKAGCKYSGVTNPEVHALVGASVESVATSRR